MAGTTDDGYVLLKLDKKTAKRIDEIRAGPIVAVGVYDDAGRLLDATGVGLAVRRLMQWLRAVSPGFRHRRQCLATSWRATWRRTRA